MEGNRRAKAIRGEHGGIVPQSDTCAAGSHLSRRNPERYGQPLSPKPSLSRDRLPHRATRGLIAAPAAQTDAAMIPRALRRRHNPDGLGRNRVRVRLAHTETEVAQAHAFKSP